MFESVRVRDVLWVVTSRNALVREEFGDSVILNAGLRIYAPSCTLLLLKYRCFFH